MNSPIRIEVYKTSRVEYISKVRVEFWCAKVYCGNETTENYVGYHWAHEDKSEAIRGAVKEWRKWSRIFRGGGLANVGE